MKTVVTVTCTRDKWFMALQAQSLDRFVHDPFLHIVIIEDSKTSLEEWRDWLMPFYNRHTLMILTNKNFPSLYPLKYGNRIQGWHRQQILKLNISKILCNDYLVLDSKNIFIKPVVISGFNIEGNGDRISISSMPADYAAWTEQLCKDLNYTPINYWGISTPFLFKISVVKTILSSIDIESMFAIDGVASEFILYRFFSDTKIKQFDIQVVCLGENSHKDINELNRLCKPNSIKILTVHRTSFQNNTDRSIIEEFLISKNFDINLVQQALTNTYGGN